MSVQTIVLARGNKFRDDPFYFFLRSFLSFLSLVRHLVSHLSSFDNVSIDFDRSVPVERRGKCNSGTQLLDITFVIDVTRSRIFTRSNTLTRSPSVNSGFDYFRDIGLPNNICRKHIQPRSMLRRDWMSSGRAARFANGVTWSRRRRRVSLASGHLLSGSVVWGTAKTWTAFFRESPRWFLLNTALNFAIVFSSYFFSLQKPMIRR